MGSEIPFISAFTKAASLKSASFSGYDFAQPVVKHLLRISQHPVQQYMSWILEMTLLKIIFAKATSNQSIVVSSGFRSTSKRVNTASNNMIALVFSYGALLSIVVRIAGHKSNLRHS